MDLLQGVQEGLDIVETQEILKDVPKTPHPNEPFMPSLEKLLEAVEKLDISEENRRQLRKNLAEKAKSGTLGQFLPKSAQNLASEAQNFAENDGYNIILMLGLILIIFALLGMVFILIVCF